jgi:DNA helicase-2/ATP-dependent DNA helicase PcrA
MRARLVDWGSRIFDKIKEDPGAYSIDMNLFQRIDLNRLRSGTIDAVCEEILNEIQDPDWDKPRMVEDFVSRVLFRRSVIMPNRDQIKESNFVQFVSLITGQAGLRFPNDHAIISNLKPLVDRLSLDCINSATFTNGADSEADYRKRFDSYLKTFQNELKKNGLSDFTMLESVFLDALTNDLIAIDLESLLIDEYQDTNPLQEQIYFAFISKLNPTLTVVGDDDQALYRFRGASVELFTKFADRVRTLGKSKKPVKRYNLIKNYRSNPNIVEYFNSFLSWHPNYTGARVQPPKPEISAARTTGQFPVLGLFRQNKDELAEDLAQILAELFKNRRVTCESIDGDTIEITASGKLEHGAAEAVLLSSRVQERNASGRVRLPGILRNELQAHGINVFNPRGRKVSEVEDIGILLGLLSLCFDPDGGISRECFFTVDTRQLLTDWRSRAQRYLGLSQIIDGKSLNDFYLHWINRSPYIHSKWPESVPVLEVFFKLLTWFPAFQDSPEGQIYVESICRVITEGTVLTKFGGKIFFTEPFTKLSVKEFYNFIFTPIAQDEVAVDEELLPSLPSNCLPVMTIHQSKGLEFPLVLLDAGSDFDRNYHQQKAFRFPESPGQAPSVENYFSEFNPDLREIRKLRTPLERTFDDIVRQYYVGMSRAQDVLIILGLSEQLSKNSRIRHVAYGWAIDGTWAWSDGQEKHNELLAGKIPLVLI